MNDQRHQQSLSRGMSRSRLAALILVVVLLFPAMAVPAADAVDSQRPIPSPQSGAQSPLPWSFIAPVATPLPPVKQSAWPQNPIDYFVLARLEAEGLTPSPLADRNTLIRRVSLDLIGLPPTPEEVDEFVKDPGPDAFEKVVDRLLRSTHYGERWARRWLDLARYSDTCGYTTDSPRSIWPYRDWVINALNADLPFDQFTIEQIAGDLLPNASLIQKIATGFHRNTMLNEEGGIDPLEFRYHAMTDRVGTTGRVWLGLTLQCAQCHDHKFDPISQRDFYRIFACLNNADEPELELPDSAIAARALENQRTAEALTTKLVDQWPVPEISWQPTPPLSFESAGGRPLKMLPDGSASFTGIKPGEDTFMLVIDSDLSLVDRVLLEARVIRVKEPMDISGVEKDSGPSSPTNFVRYTTAILAAPKSDPGNAHQVELLKANVLLAPEEIPRIDVVAGEPVPGEPGVSRDRSRWRASYTETYVFKRPVGFPGGTRFRILIRQLCAGRDSVEAVRFSVGVTDRDDRPAGLRRAGDFERKFGQWLDRERERSVHWIPLRPTSATSNLPRLTVQDDDSVFVSGDMTKRDTYEVRFRPGVRGITAVRLEALPDDRLPAHGPGMGFYEGPKGDFFLGEFQLSADGLPVTFARTSESYAKNNFSSSSSAALLIDGDPQTGWTCAGRPGERHEAVFQTLSPIDARELDFKLICGRQFPCDLGRFRISVTADSVPAEARDLPDDIEQLLLVPDGKLTPEQRSRLRRQFTLVAPELATAREPIRSLLKPPGYPTTLVMRERPIENPRPTFVHQRGEFLLPTEPVAPGVLSGLNPFPPGAPTNRLGLARWLVSSDNPLTARVTMNRQWGAFFGLGIVRTVDDFGTQGEPPVDPRLLDWLAVEFMKQHWSLKKMHRLIVMSATYQQSSRVTPELLARDPENRLFARGPRVRLEAELIRDSTLQIAGLLSEEIGGPSVFPLQPDGVTTEGPYGPLEWMISPGSDRYRRGLYTFSKRSAPYAMFATFDAPSGETCVAQRDVSDTPMQALTILNDPVFFEAARSLAYLVALHPGDTRQRLDYLFLRCFARPPAPEEAAALLKFFRDQLQRFTTAQLDAARIASGGQTDVNERAAWIAVIRVLFSLDEAVTKG
jgi:hypothetical protein